LATALATRLCHDLAGTLGSLMGALEMAKDDPDLHGEALSLAHDATSTLSARLRLTRIAWGALADPISTAELTDLAAGLPRGRRMRLHLDGLTSGRRFAPDAARLLLNLLMLALESLAGAGDLTISDTPNGDTVLTISGPRAAWPHDFARQLANADIALDAIADLDARSLQGPLTALIAHASGRHVSLLLSPQAEQPPPLLATLG